MIIQKNLNFFKNINTPTVSKVYSNAVSDVLSLQIDGDFADALIHIEGRSADNGSWFSLAGISLEELSLVRGGITKPGLYEFGVEGVRQLRARIERISGQVSASGHLISIEET